MLGQQELVLRGTGCSSMGRMGVLGVGSHGPGQVAPLGEVQRAQPGSCWDLQHDSIRQNFNKNGCRLSFPSLGRKFLNPQPLFTHPKLRSVWTTKAVWMSMSPPPLIHFHWNSLPPFVQLGHNCGCCRGLKENGAHCPFFSH